AYAYLSANNKQFGYNFLLVINGTKVNDTDCAALGVNPYAETFPPPNQAAPTPRFLNPDSFQLISAGPDGAFGSGTTDQNSVWSASNPGPTATNAGKDDISNFSPIVLGAGQ